MPRLWYATSHFKVSRDAADVVIYMGIIVDELEAKGVEVIRQKLELVIYDTNSPKVAA